MELDRKPAIWRPLTATERSAVGAGERRSPVVTLSTIGLLVVLLVYTGLGCALAFNLGGISGRLGRHFKDYPGLLRPIGGDNPQAWRASGLVMLVFGAFVLD